MTVCHGSMAPQADDTEETNKTLVASDAAAKAQTMTFANMQSFFFMFQFSNMGCLWLFYRRRQQLQRHNQ